MCLQRYWYALVGMGVGGGVKSHIFPTRPHTEPLNTGTSENEPTAPTCLQNIYACL